MLRVHCAFVSYFTFRRMDSPSVFDTGLSQELNESAIGVYFGTHVGDFDLVHFNLTRHDYDNKIRYIKLANDLSDRGIKLFASAWSPPAWMKTNGQMESNGTLKGDTKGPYYKTWGNYIIKFLQAFKDAGVEFWGLTAQNEPGTGFIYNYEWQTCGFTAAMQRDFVKYHLGPSLHENGFETTKLMIIDDARFMIPLWTNTILDDFATNGYVSGIAVHWYENFMAPLAVLDWMKQYHPNKFVLATEACFISVPSMGNWARGEGYASDIIENLNHWTAGWTDWNMALNTNGGPSWVGATLDSPIIVNKTSDEFYKQPMFYAMGHFSKYILPGSHRIDWKWSNDLPPNSQVQVTAAVTPEHQNVVVIMNKSNSKIVLKLTDTKAGRTAAVMMDPREITTFVWNN